MHINFDNQTIKKYMLEGQIGLEKESLRVTDKGRLAQSKHPFSDSKITRDFCENQVEIVTDPFDSAKEVYESLSKLHKSTCLFLKNHYNNEYLWPFSNPPYITGEAEIPIAHFEYYDKDKELYREYLAKKYGKKKMLFSGIHYNYSYSEQFLASAFEQSEINDFQTFKNKLYLEAAQKVLEYAWFIVYLTSASPVFDPSYFDHKEEYESINGKYGSCRCSEIGYWNSFTPVLRYDDLPTYIQSIQTYVESKIILQPSELYYPVRLKPKGINSLTSLKIKGINHLELRMIDLNPLSEIGIFEEDILFIQAFLVYILSFESKYPLSLSNQIQVITDMKEGAKYDDEQIKISFRGKLLKAKDASMIILKEMKELYQDNEEICSVITYQIKKIETPDHRYCHQIWNKYKDDFKEKGLSLIKDYTSHY